MSSYTSIDARKPDLHSCDMATMGSRIRELRANADISQAKFGELFGVSREAVSQWEKGKSTPEQPKLEAIAARYAVSLDWLAGKDQPQGDKTPVDIPSRALGREIVSGLDFQVGAQTLDSWPRDLKIIGHVKAGVDGFFLDQGEHHGMAHRPPALQSVKDAFAVYVQDDSMVPAFEPGQIVWVHPTRPVAPGNNVIIELADGQAFIKRLVRRTVSKVVCLQWLPKREVEYDAKKVKRLYYVVGAYRED